MMTKKELRAALMLLPKSKLVNKIIALEDQTEYLMLQAEVLKLGVIAKEDLLDYLINQGYHKKQIKKWFPHLYEN